MARSSANSLLQRELLDTIKSLRTTIESLQGTIECFYSPDLTIN